jgi:galactokinase
MDVERTPFFEASAPGRLDVMGGIADYSGSLVLQLPIQEKTSVKIKLRTDYRCTLHSKTNSESFDASLDYRSLLQKGKVSYDFAHRQFKKNHPETWEAYVVGCALVLQKEKDIEFTGADFIIQSDVPLGKGVSSSAALEVATMKALGLAFNLSFSGTELPVLAQRVENSVVGAPCGLMDQLTSFFGEPRKLLPILCQPDQMRGPVVVPPSVFFVGIDSGVRHSVKGSSYEDVRCAAFMGYTIIIRSMGVSEKDILRAIAKDDFSQLPYGGYLCNIPVAEFETRFKDGLTDFIAGKDFLGTYGRTIDRVTSVKPAKRYAITPCTAHPIYENDRVHQFIGHLDSINRLGDSEPIEDRLKKMGDLMTGSHESYSKCGLGSDRTDEIVALAKEKAHQGIFGAKITGGGNGGTVCLLASGPAGRDAIKELHLYCEKKFGTALSLFN